MTTDLKIILWDETCSVGNATLDAQHQTLIHRINELIEYIQNVHTIEYESVIDALNFMSSYSLNHFITEELLLAKHHFNELETHKEYHKAFLEKSVDFCKLANKDLGKVLPEIVGYIQHWWFDHILIHDMKYRTLFRAS